MFRRSTQSRHAQAHLKSAAAAALRSRVYGKPVEALETRRLLAAFTWEGDVNSLFSEPGNWNSVDAPGTVPDSADDTLTFPEVANKSLNNDILGLSVNTMTFSAAGYTLSGNALTINNDIDATHGAGTTTIAANLTLGAAGIDLRPSNVDADIVVNNAIETGANLLTTTGDGDVIFNGVISGSGGLTRTTGGNTFLEADNTYTGITTINSGGDIIVSDPPGGVQGTGLSDVVVNGNLRGDGQIGDIDVNGTGVLFVGLPGTIPTTLITEDVIMATGSALRFNVAGTGVAGTNYDQLRVVGGVLNLGGVNLVIDVDPAFTSTAGDQIVLVDNDGIDAVINTFTDLPEGATRVIGDRTFTISYVGGSDNNDIVLTDTTSTVNPNDPPVNTVPTTTQNVLPGGTITFDNNEFSVSDPDAGTSPLLVTLTATGGTLTLGGTTNLTNVTGDGTGTVSFTGAQADVNNALQGLTYTATGTGAQTIQIVTNDQGATGGDAQSDTDVVNVNISDTPAGNQPPVNQVPGAQSTAQNTSVTFSIANDNEIQISDPDAGADDVQVTLTATNGTVSLANASPTGVAVTGGDGSEDATVTLTGTVANINAALDALTFEPATGFTGAAELRIVTNDLGNNGDGGEQTDTDTVTINVVSAGDVQFSAANFNVDENAGIAQVTITRSSGGGAASVDVATSNATATEGQDYIATNTTVDFADGQTEKTFTVAISDDIRDEDDETINLTLSNPGGAAGLGEQQTATVTIVDNDPTPTLAITDLSVAEGNEGNQNGVFTVILSAPSNRTVTVNYATEPGTATLTQDFINAAGTVTFEPGQTTQTIEVPIIGDAFDEPTETFDVVLADPVNATIDRGAGVGTIVNDDLGGPLGLFINDVIIVEGDEGSTDAQFTVQLSRAPAENVNVTVDYATANGTAIAGEDFGGREIATLTFSGTTTSQTITVPITGDGVDEPNETFTVTLSNVSNAELADGTATGTIVDDDEPVGVSVSDVTVDEDDAGGAVFTVTLSEASAQAVSVQFTTANDSAEQGLDFTTTAGTLAFAAGETSKTITVPIINDETDEGDQTFFVTLSAPENALLIDAQGLGTIQDDDDPAGPEANDDEFTRPVGVAPVVLNVLANDLAFVGTNPTITIVQQPTGGTAVVNADNTITYTPASATAGGLDTLRYRASNNEGSGEADVLIGVTGATVGQDPQNPSQTALFVVGDTAANKINISRRRGQLRVRIDRTEAGLFDVPTGRVVVIGGDGDDRLRSGAFRGPVRLYGGSGNDRINGGRFSDILIGGAGDDRINGGGARDILIGGAGADRLNGGGDEDILIAGPTSFDIDTEDNRAALGVIFDEWIGAAPYTTRVTNITGPDGIGESGAGFRSSTTQDDALEDRLSGGGGDDLYIANEQGGGVADRLRGRKGDRETLIDLDVA